VFERGLRLDKGEFLVDGRPPDGSTTPLPRIPANAWNDGVMNWTTRTLPDDVPYRGLYPGKLLRTRLP